MSIPPAEAPRLAAIRAQLDAALLGLREIRDPHLPVRRAEDAIAGALQQVYGATAAGGDYGAFRERTHEAAERVRAALAHLQATSSDDAAALLTLERVASTLSSLLHAVHHPDDGARLPSMSGRPVRASIGEPTLLDPPRGVHLPRVLLPELGEPELSVPESAPPPPLRTVDEVRAMMRESQLALATFEAPPPASDERKRPRSELPPAPPRDDDAEREHFGVAVSEAELLRERAREAFEDLAMLGLMRRHHGAEGQTWLGRERPEQRLLARVDAIVACGADLMPQLLDLLEDRPLPDPELTWAAIFLYASIAGDDSIDQAVRIAECCDLTDPVMAERVADAFSWAPHPRIDGVMRRWAEHPDAVRRASAIRALTRRRRMTLEIALSACRDPDARVVLEGARALGVAADEVHASTFVPLLEHADGTVVQAAIESAFLRGLSIGYARAAYLVREGTPDTAGAVAYVAIGADRADGLALLMEAAGTSGSALVLRAIGAFGSVESVPYLLARLEGNDESAALAALAALQQITGASLTDVDLAPTYPREALPFEHGFTEREDLLLALDPEAWRVWWKTHGRRADARVRYRRGHRWTCHDALHELADPLGGPFDRRLCHLELIARSGLRHEHEHEHFVHRQRAQLSEWRSALGGGQPGLWPVRWSA